MLVRNFESGGYVLVPSKDTTVGVSTWPWWGEKTCDCRRLPREMVKTARYCCKGYIFGKLQHSTSWQESAGFNITIP